MADDAKAQLRALKARLATAATADAVAGEFERRVRRYCGERGIPQSVFLGRALNEETTVTYHRDDDGQLVVSRVTVRDPEWLPGDIVAALQYQTEQDALCSGCGQPRAESFDTDSRYDVETHRCVACAGLGQKGWLAQKNRSKNATPQFGVYHSVKKRKG